jgi:hypothetical protein|tara:strand:- start:6129 stop:6431 length:303 start_codon:yes stop_codon:yes gene_type:complete
MKKGPLSNAEKKYIEENQQYLKPSAMATALNRSVGIVERYLDDLAKPETPTKALYATNEERGVTISTMEASMASDKKQERRKEAANGVPPRYGKHIHKIK